MTDDLRLLAAADPAPAGRCPEGWLDDTAEAHLRALAAGGATSDRTAGRRPCYVRRAVLATVASGIAATLVVIATDGPGAPAPAPVEVQPVAAPAPLVVDPDRPVPSLDELAATAKERAGGVTTSAVRGSHVRAWYLGFGAEGEGFPAVVLPEERLSVPDADGGLTVTRVPADPRRPAEVRLEADGPAPDGAEVSVVSAAQLARETVERIPPPADPASLGDHLAAVWAPAPPETAGLLDALEQVLLRWTPGPAEDAAIVGWLAQQSDLVALGAVTDRLGRPGAAYALDATPDGASFATRRTVVLDPFTGRVLSTELSFLGDTGEWDVEPYAVMSYVAYGVG